MRCIHFWPLIRLLHTVPKTNTVFCTNCTRDAQVQENNQHLAQDNSAADLRSRSGRVLFEIFLAEAQSLSPSEVRDMKQKWGNSERTDMAKVDLWTRLLTYLKTNFWKVVFEPLPSSLVVKGFVKGFLTVQRLPELGCGTSIFFDEYHKWFWSTSNDSEIDYHKLSLFKTSLNCRPFTLSWHPG